ncbi:MAG: envelope stress response membrane protein PspC [Gammaproteobacteria bacterium]|jgi:phage shock protein C|nr:envelope stress response membrane protein PspC [Gammaproteobacteria bacterium]
MKTRKQRNRQGSGNNPHRLYRNRDNRMIAGVCAGIADYFGFETSMVRVATVIAAIPFSTAIIIGYVILAIILPTRPANLYPDDEHEDFWRGVANQPKDLLGELRHRFRDLELRLQKMEAYVTSRRYDIDRELRD